MANSNSHWPSPHGNRLYVFTNDDHVAGLPIAEVNPNDNISEPYWMEKFVLSVKRMLTDSVPSETPWVMKSTTFLNRAKAKFSRKDRGD